MAVYTVLAPQARDGSTLPNAMELVFVKEGFNWPALFFAGPWLIYRRLWLVLAGYVGAALVISLASRWLGDSAPGGVMLLVHLFFALEANALRVWTLQRNGYRLVGVVQGRGIEEAEIRYFSEIETAPAASPAIPTPPVPPVPPPQRPIVTRPSAEAGDVVGLFPAPGGAAS